MSESTEQENLPQMSFWDHIYALRSVLLRIALIVSVLSVGFFIFMPNIFNNIILWPCREDFCIYKALDIIPYFSSESAQESGMIIDLINIQLSSQIMIHITTSFWLGLIFSFPIIVYVLWGFIKPALYKHERTGVRKAFFFGNIMFYLGIAVGYFIVFPFSLRFLASYQVSELINNQFSINSYMDNFLVLIFLMGIVFELPLIAWLLSKAEVLTKSFFNKYRRHAIVVLMIIAAIITPADPFSMIILFIPLYALFETSSFFVKSDSKEPEE